MSVVLALVLVALGAVLRGFAGFGASMFWVASLCVLFPPAGVVPTVLAIEVVASVLLLPRVAGRVHWSSMRWLLAGTLVAIPAGAALLVVLPEQPMRIVVAGGVLLAALMLLSGVATPMRPSARSGLLAGVVSGVMNGSTGIGGPPAIVLYFSGATAAEVGRATLIVYFLITDAAALAYLACFSLVDGTVLGHSLVLTPVVLVGVLVGQRLFDVRGSERLRGLVPYLLLVLALGTLTQVLVGWGT